LDIFTRFNRKAIDDRQVDTLIGLSKGLLADGKIDLVEGEALRNWLVQNRRISNHPVIVHLYDRITAMFADNVLDQEESHELLITLQQIAGDPTELGEIAKSASLPTCKPAPDVAFPGKNFLFTGTCVFGTRKECQLATEKLGGVCASGVTKSLNYLVLGTYVTDSWAHESFGRKIEKAMMYRNEGVPLSIVTEEHWANFGGLR
jgi:NAD-dependent DNA ligase